MDASCSCVPIGRGAWSGKDFFKVDRLGGMAARRVALESLLASEADGAGAETIPTRDACPVDAT